MAASQLDSVKLLTLEPTTRAKVKELIGRLAARGLKIKLGSTRRTEEEQQAAIDADRSGATISWHLTGRAVDVLVWDPGDAATGRAAGWDEAGRRLDLYRIVHQEWAKLGGFGLAFGPYPDGPIRYITSVKSGKKLWDGGHLEYHGPYATASAAYKAERAA